MNINLNEMLKIIKQDASFFKKIPEQQKKNVNFAFDALSINPNVYPFLEYDFRRNNNFIIEYVKKGGCSEELIPYLTENKQLLKTILSINSSIIVEIDENLKEKICNDKELLIAALSSGNVSKYGPSSLLNSKLYQDKEVAAYMAISTLGEINIPEMYKNDIEFAKILSVVCKKLNIDTNNPIFKLECKKQFNENVFEDFMENSLRNKDNDDVLKMLDYSLLTTCNKYNVSNCIAALVNDDSKYITDDDNARKEFDSLSKIEIDKQMLKFAVKASQCDLNNYQYSISSKAKRNLNFLYHNAYNNLSLDCQYGELMHETIVEVFSLRYMIPNNSELLRNEIDKKNKYGVAFALENVDKYFDTKKTKNNSDINQNENNKSVSFPQESISNSTIKKENLINQIVSNNNKIEILQQQLQDLQQQNREIESNINLSKGDRII